MELLVKIFGVIVSTFFTNTGGVSLSEVNRNQAESKQQNDEFWSKISEATDNIFQKEMLFVGAGDGTVRTLAGATIAPSELDAYADVASRNALTANLMHALKLHKRLQDELKAMDLRLHVVESLPKAPEYPGQVKTGSTCSVDRFMDLSNIDEMIASLSPEVLAKFDFAFWKRANELNSRAAVLGKLISESGSFFRELVKSVPKDSEKTLQTGIVVTAWKRAYSPDAVTEFNSKREELQLEYNNLQKQLNGCKKQVKDAVRAYNLDEERRYQAEYGIYMVEAEKHAMEMERIRSSAETLRQEAQRELATLRVKVE